MEVYAGKESAELLDYLLKRRSVMADNLCMPGPNSDELEQILTAASRVPDHGKLCPFYFLVFQGDARLQAGDILADAYLKSHADASKDRVEFERKRFMRAPLVVAIISRQRMGKNPLWEQILSAGAAAQNFSLATHACGYAVQWLTEWYAFDDHVKGGLGLDARDHVVGFMYVGTAEEQPEERDRPELSKIVNHWQPDMPLEKGDLYDREKFGFPAKGFSFEE